MSSPRCWFASTSWHSTSSVCQAVSGALILDVWNEFYISVGHDIHTFINSEQVRRDAFTKMTNDDFSLWEATIGDMVSNYGRDMAAWLLEYTVCAQSRPVTWDTPFHLWYSAHPKIWYDSVAANSCAGPVSHGACPKVRSLICGMFERGWKYIGTWRSDTICQNTSYSGWS